MFNNIEIRTNSDRWPSFRLVVDGAMVSFGSFGPSGVNFWYVD